MPRKAALVAMSVLPALARIHPTDPSDACVAQLAGMVNNIAAGDELCKRAILDAGLVDVLADWLQLADRTAAQAGPYA